MKKIFPIFLLFFIIENSYSIQPKRDVYELPIISKNTNIVYKNMKYFAFPIKDLPKPSRNDLYYFIMTSTNTPKNISYTFFKDSKGVINFTSIAEDKYRTWFKPNITKKQHYSNKTIYEFSIYANHRYSSRQSIIIRIGPSLKFDQVTCQPLYNGSLPISKKLNITIEKYKNYTETYKPKHDTWKKPSHNHSHNKPPSHNHSHHKHKRNHHEHHRYNISERNSKEYQEYEYYEDKGESFTLGLCLIAVWSILIILYYLTNRRKKPVVAVIKNQPQISLSNYQNI